MDKVFWQATPLPSQNLASPLSPSHAPVKSQNPLIRRPNRSMRDYKKTRFEGIMFTLLLGNYRNSALRRAARSPHRPYAAFFSLAAGLGQFHAKAASARVLVPARPSASRKEVAHVLVQSLRSNRGPIRTEAFMLETAHFFCGGCDRLVQKTSLDHRDCSCAPVEYCLCRRAQRDVGAVKETAREPQCPSPSY